MIPGNLQAWLLATRPRTLIASAAPVCVGLAVASRRTDLDWFVALATLTTALLLQIAANLANDYADAQTGVDAAGRHGPVRVTQSGLIDATSVRRATIATILAATISGCLLIAAGGWPVLWLGVVAVLAALGYSTGPAPLSWYGLGELLAFVFFGPVAVVGTAYLQTGRVDGEMFLASLPAGLMAAALMSVNNLRDIDTDAAVGKRTLAVRLGADRTRAAYGALMLLSFAAILLLARGTGWPTLLPMLVMPLAAVETQRLWHRREAELNQSLTRTAMLGGVTGLLLALGLVL